MANEPEIESKFLKSGLNRRTENAGLDVLLQDPHHRAVTPDLKAAILDSLGVPEAPRQAFDAVRTVATSGPLTAINLADHLPGMQLVEMKTTRKAIFDDRLEGFFFGVTESELALAERLGDRYLFAFVVLNQANAYGRDFFVLLTFDQLNIRIRSKRVQFQVTLSRGIKDLAAPYGTGPGELLPFLATNAAPSDRPTTDAVPREVVRPSTERTRPMKE